MATINDIFKEYLEEYLKANRKRKGQILKHVCFVTKFHRKAAIRKFGNLQLQSETCGEKRGRPLYYTPDVTVALKDVWEAASEVCGELLYPIVKEYVKILQRDKLWNHSDEATGKLLAMSEGTMKDRVDEFMKARTSRSGISATKPSNLKTIIPIFTGPWEDKPPGYGQVDTVVHCGSSLVGDMVFTVNWTDVSSLWGKRRAQWNKGQTATMESLSKIKELLPFSMLGAHPDTGSEFINIQVMKWSIANNVELTRSRPYHKNDNAYVEQKNGHIVRRFLGYTRLDCPKVITTMNELYDILDLYLNHFVASRKCLEKVRIGSRYKKKYDKARTPYERLMLDARVSSNVKAKLKTEHESLNPLLLKRKVDTLIAKVFKIQRDSADPKYPKVR